MADLLTRAAFLLSASLSSGQNCCLHIGNLNRRMRYRTDECLDNLGPPLPSILLNFQSRGKATRLHPHHLKSHHMYCFHTMHLCCMTSSLLCSYFIFCCPQGKPSLLIVKHVKELGIHYTLFSIQKVGEPDACLYPGG